MYQKREIFYALNCTCPENFWEAECFNLKEKLTSPYLSHQADSLLKQGELYLKKPVPELPYSLFRIYWESGDRGRYESRYFERRGRLMVFSLLSFLYPEENRFSEALNDIIWAICSEPFWCVPAHFMDEEEHGIPFTEYDTQLDLFSCETASALAETLCINGSRITEQAAMQARLHVQKRVLEPFLDGHRFYRFEVMANNWSSVCASALGIAAIYLMDDTKLLTSLLHRVMSCLQVFIDSFGDDGICVEGIGYWTYGVGFLTCFSDLLEKRTGGTLNLFQLPKFAALAKAQQYAYICGPQTIPFADAHECEGFRIGISTRLKRTFPAIDLPDLSLAHDILDDTCFRFCFALRDLMWFDTSTVYAIPGELSCYLPDAQWFISRRDGFALLAKAGSNGESHNHNDCGSFVYYSGGLPLIRDLGVGNYTAQYFGPERYSLFLPSSRSHNVAVIGGLYQAPGLNHRAENTVCTFEKDKSVFETELSRCYSHPQLISYHRKLTHLPATGELTLEDSFEFSRAESIAETFVSSSPIIAGEGQAVFHTERAGCLLEYNREALTSSLSEEVYEDHSGRKQTAYLLHLTSGQICSRQTFLITVRPSGN